MSKKKAIERLLLVGVGLAVALMLIFVGISTVAQYSYTKVIECSSFYTDDGTYFNESQGGNIRLMSSESAVNSEQELRVGQSAYVKAVPTAGYSFVGFYSTETFEKDTLISSNSLYSFTVEETTPQIYAKFAKNYPVTLNIELPNGETTSFTKDFYFGQEVSVVDVITEELGADVAENYTGATPTATDPTPAGYELREANFTVGSTAKALSLTPKKQVAVGAGQHCYYSDDGSNLVGTGGGLIYERIDPITHIHYFSATADTGYVFVGWYETSESSFLGSDYFSTVMSRNDIRAEIQINTSCNYLAYFIKSCRVNIINNKPTDTKLSWSTEEGKPRYFDEKLSGQDNDYVDLYIGQKITLGNGCFISYIDTLGTHTISSTISHTPTYGDGTNVCITITYQAIYTIYFDKKGGEDGFDMVYLNYNVGYYKTALNAVTRTSSITSIDIPSKDNNTFDGYYSINDDESWNTQYFDSDGKGTTFLNATVFSRDCYIFAKWTKGATTYTVTVYNYYYNISSSSYVAGTTGGEIGFTSSTSSQNSISKTCAENEVVYIYATSNSGYGLSMISLDTTGDEVLSSNSPVQYQVVEDTTFYVLFTDLNSVGYLHYHDYNASNYNASFTGDTNPNPNTLPNGTESWRPNSPTKSGYSFTKWGLYVGDSPSKSGYYSDWFSLNIRGGQHYHLYAYWTVKTTATVKLYSYTSNGIDLLNNCNGGQVSFTDNTYSDNVEISAEKTKNATTSIYAKPKTNYVFKGFNTNASGTGTWLSATYDSTNGDFSATTPAVSADVSYYAFFEPMGGTGTSASPFQITNARRLGVMSHIVNNLNSAYGSLYYSLTNDITLTDTNNHTPIGNNTKRFDGTFDGQNHTVSGINIIASANYTGFFGALDTSAVVKNLTVSGTVAGGEFDQIGGLTGAGGGTIINCRNECNVLGRLSVGGIAGGSLNADYINCSNTGNIRGTSQYVGGILGGVGGYYVTIKNCYNKGTITGTTSGGILGYSSVTESTNGIQLLNNYSITSIYGSIVGSYNKTITDCQLITDATTLALANSVTIGTITTQNLWVALNAWVLNNSGNGYYYWQDNGSGNFPTLTGSTTAPSVAFGKDIKLGETALTLTSSANILQYKSGTTTVLTVQSTTAINGGIPFGTALTLTVTFMSGYVNSGETNPRLVYPNTSYGSNIALTGTGPYTLSNIFVGGTLTAVAKLLTYNIGYTLNGGTSGASAPTSATYNTTVTIDNPTRTNYTFAGWTAEGLAGEPQYHNGTQFTTWSNGSTAVKATQFKNLSNNDGATVTLIATWTENTYTLRITGNNASLGSCSVSGIPLQSVAGTGDFTLTETTVVGKAFKLVFTTASGSTLVPMIKIGYGSASTDYTHLTTGYYENASFPTLANNSIIYVDCYGFVGSGTEAVPYQISSATDLGVMRDLVGACSAYEEYITVWNTTGINYKLMNNLTLSSNWTGIGKVTTNGKFKGIFDGNSKTITNNNGSCAVFAVSEGIIKNLIFSGNCNTTTQQIGGICWRNNGTIYNCTNNATIVLNGDGNIGGISSMNYGTIYNCTNTGAIAGTTGSVGGICGLNNGTIYNCANFGGITGTTGNVGGVVGTIGEGTCTVLNCLSTGSVSGGTVGALAGANSSVYTYPNYSYALSGTANSFNGGGYNGWQNQFFTHSGAGASATNTLASGNSFNIDGVSGGDITTTNLTIALNAWVLANQPASAVYSYWAMDATTGYPKLTNSTTKASYGVTKNSGKFSITPSTTPLAFGTAITITPSTGHNISSVTYSPTDCKDINNTGTGVQKCYVLDTLSITVTTSANDCTITYYKTTGVTSTAIVKYDATYSLPTAPTRDGYTFAGWSEGNDNSAEWTSGSRTCSGDKSWYAVWKRSAYVIANYNGTTTNGEAQTSYTNYSGAITSIANCSRPWDITVDKSGYIFVAFTSNTNIVNNTTSSPSGVANEFNITCTGATTTLNIYATYKRAWILYYSSSQTSSNTYYRHDVTANASFSLEDNFNVTTGFTRAGWSTSNTAVTNNQTSAPTIVTNPTMTTASGTFYSVYKRVWTTNNTSSSSPVTTAYYLHTVAASASFTQSISNPTLSGYTFVGYSTGDDAVSEVAKGTSSTGLALTGVSGTWYAVWQKNITQTITYDANGHGSAPANSTGSVAQTYNYTTLSSGTAKTATVAIGTMSVAGYTFGGWSTVKNGTKVSDGGVDKTFSITADATTTYYALWSVNSYTVTAKSNGGTIASTTGWTGTGASATKSVTYDATYGTLPSVSRTGYTFGGWYLPSNTTTELILSASTGLWNYGVILTNLVPGVSYYINIETATRTAGTADKFTTLIYDFTTSTSLVNVQNSFGTNVGYIMTCPSTANAEDNLRLIVYAGVSGSTANNAVSYTGISIIPSTATALTTSTIVKAEANHTIFARWSANSYTVAYNSNKPSTASGSITGSTASSMHTYGVAKNLTTNGYALTGWTFGGWNTKADGTGANYGNSASVTNLSSTNGTTVTLYAKWSINSYNVKITLAATLVTAVPSISISDGSTSKTITANGGTATYVYTYGASYTITASESGSNFYHLRFTGSVGNTIQESISSTGTIGGAVNLTLTAVQLYKVTYNGNGNTGGSVPNAIYKIHGTARVLTANSLTRTGYSANGWNTSTGLTASPAYTTSLTATVNTNTTLYANWSANGDTAYTVKHYVMNTSGGYPTTATQTEGKTGTSDATLTLSSLKLGALEVANGIAYGSGKVDGSTVTTTKIKADGSLEISLYYTRSQYVLTVEKATGISSTTGGGTYYYEAVVPINASLSSGYQWSKWTKTSGEGTLNGTTQATTYTMGTGIATVTASGALISYSIGYDLAGGSVSSANPTSYTVTTATFTLTNPTRTGYSFAGWTGTGISVATTTVSIAKGSTGNKSYVATWDINSYSVTYNATTNGGTTSATSVDVNYNSAIDLSKTATKSGWVFVGWNTDKDAHAKLNSLTMGTAPVTLYAIFSKTYTFNFYGIEVAVVGRTTTIWNTATSGTITAPALVAISGKTSIGWGNSTSATTSSIASGVAGVNTSLAGSYYAVYSHSATASYNANGGTGTTAETTGTVYTTSKGTTGTNIKGYTFNLKANGFTYVGHTFSNWAIGSISGAQKAAGTSQTITANTTYYAIWTENKVTITINKNGSAWSTSGITLKLYQSSTEKYTTSNISATSTSWSAVPAGTYDIWASASKIGATLGNVVKSSISVGVDGGTENVTINYYELTVGRDTGISAVTGTGIYLSGAEAPITATKITGYTWSKWTASGTTPSTFVASTQNQSVKLTTGPATLTASATANALTFANQEFSLSFKTIKQTQTITGASNGSGDYTYSITGGNSSGKFSISGTTIEIEASTPVGTYALTVKATDSITGANKTATKTFIISTQVVNAPTGLAVNTAGIVSWTKSSNATGYEININGGSWVTISGGATVSYDYFSALTASAGGKTINLRATNSDTTNYTTPSSTVSVTTTVYTVGFGSLTNGSAKISHTSTMGSLTTLNVISGGTVYIKATPSTGYSFSAWSKTGTGTIASTTTASTSVTSVGSAITLTATFNANTITLTYDLNKPTNMTATPSKSGTLASIAYNTVSGTAIGTASTTGWVFVGWFTAKTSGTKLTDTDGKLTSDFTASTGDALTIYAQWTANSYTIVYNKNTPVIATNAVTGTMANSMHSYDTSKALNTNTFALIGWNFSGWNTKADGTGTNYSDKVSVSNLTSTNGTSINLYAKWSQKTFTITFNKNQANATGSMSALSATYDLAKQLTANGYTYIGHSFNGWNTKSDGTGTSYTNSEGLTKAKVNALWDINDGNVTLYAQWLNVTYKLSVSATNCSVSVTRGGTTLINGSDIYVDDTLSVTFTANAGHTMVVHTINGATTASLSVTYTVPAENVSIIGTGYMEVPTDMSFRFDTEKKTATITKYTGNATKIIVPKTINKLNDITATEGGEYTITTIAPNAFEDNTTLQAIDFSDVTTIGASAFYGCTALVNILIGANVTSIDYLAFGEDNNLRNVYIQSETVSSSVNGDSMLSYGYEFGNILSNANVYILNGATVSNYITTNYNKASASVEGSPEFGDSAVYYKYTKK